MTQPTAYTPTTDFSQEEVDNVGGRSTVRTAMVDAELAAISTTLTQVLTNLSILQRDDTKLRDGFVELYNLSATCLSALTSIVPRGAWVTATEYAVGDLVESGARAYVCPVAHTSGTFATDYAAGKWQVLGATNVGSPTSIASASTQNIPDGVSTALAFDAVTGTAGATQAADGAVVRARMVVPANVSRVRIQVNLQWAASSTGIRQVLLRKNGLNITGGPLLRSSASSAGTTGMSFSSAPLTVAEGDYFTIEVFQSSGGALAISTGPNSWMSFEVLA
jgi:hypothetical protein